MKRFLPFLSFAIFFAACTAKPETEVKTVQSANQAMTDTAGLAQFHAWKTQNELNVAQVLEQIDQPAPVKEITVVRERIVEKQVPVRKQSVPRQKAPVTTVPDKTDDKNPGTLEDIVANTGNGTSESAGEEKAPSTTTESTKKEGWSKAAKGAAIGGAGGAVLGAIINKKNPAVGAAIGGVLGGAVGYGIGRSKDKKDGRY